MSTDDQITFAAEKLKRAAPNEFHEFLAATTKLVSQAQSALLAAPPEGIINAQGQAQLAARLLKLLRECSERAEQLTRR